MIRSYNRKFINGIMVLFTLIFSLCLVALSRTRLSLPNRTTIDQSPQTATLAWEMNYTDPLDDLWFLNATDNGPCPALYYDGRVDIRNVTLLNNTVPTNYTVLLNINNSILPTATGLTFQVRLYYRYFDYGENQGYVYMESTSFGTHFSLSAYHWNGSIQEQLTAGAGYQSPDGLYYNWTFPKAWIQAIDPDGLPITYFWMTAYSEFDKTSAPQYTISDTIANAQFSYIFPPSNGSSGNGGSGGDQPGGQEEEDTPQDLPLDFPWIWVGGGIIAGGAVILAGVVLRQKRNKLR